MRKSKQFVLTKFFPIHYIFIFILISFISMAIFFPREKIKAVIADADRKNIYLDIKYLEGLAKREETPEVLTRLIQLHSRVGNYERAFYFSEKLGKYDKEASLKYKYEVLKKHYFLSNSLDIKEKLEKTIRELHIYIDDYKNLQNMYEESMSLGLYTEAVNIAKRIYLITGNKEWLLKAVKLAHDKGDYTKAVELGKLAKKKDSRLSIIIYKSYLAMKDFKNASYHLTEALKLEKKLRKIYVKDLLWVYGKSQKDPVPLLLKFAEESNEKETRRLFIEHAIKIALWKEDFDEAKNLISKYALTFIEEPDFITFLIKSALATGDSDFAGNIAKRIAEHMEIIQ